MDDCSNSLKDITVPALFYCVCRCCLANNIELKSIFKPVGSIPEAVFLFTAVKFEENDNLPKTICITCLDQLNKFISFKRKIETTDLLLRKYLVDSSQKNCFQRSYDVLKDHDYAQPNENAFEVNVESCNEVIFEDDNKKQKRSSSNLNVENFFNKHTNLFRCNQCGKKFIDKTIFANHQMCHLPATQSALSPSTKPVFTCPHCEENFATDHDLFVHSSLHEDSHIFVCKTCNKKCLTFSKLKRHIPSHFKEKPFKCQKCEMRFVEMASLTRHFRKHTGPKSMHLCLVCNKSFPNRYTLKVHNRSHTGERPWKCGCCDKLFTDFRLLNSHERVHDEFKPYECKTCNKSFRHRSTLVSHMRTHATATRPYRCDKCKKAYKQFWSLKIHKRTHFASKKSFLCDQCCQMFTSTASLGDHLQWHSKKNKLDNSYTPKEKPSEFFQCNECLAQLLSRLDLITHQKLTHACRHECDTCFDNRKTIEELVQHKCNQVLKASDEPTPDEMILLPNGEIQDCNTIVNTLLASVSQPSAATADDKGKKA